MNRAAERQTDRGDHLFEFAILGGFALGLDLWAGGQLAVLLRRGHLAPASVTDALTVVIHLRGHLTDPKGAWPLSAQPLLPGAALYWFATAVTTAAGAGVAWVLCRLLRHPGEPLDRRRRLGVPVQGRLARARELRPLLARRPKPGRLVLGRFGRRLVLTDDPDQKGRRIGMGRAAVALIGPTRSGKTTAAIGGILDWHGPAILCSVKADLLTVTEARRASCGPVHVFDPTGSAGRPTATWSPLRSATSVQGAVKAARALVEAAPRTGNSNAEQGDFWLQMAEGLVAALLALAANAQGRTFADVTRWVLSTDMPTGDFVGEVAPILRALKADPAGDRKAVGELASTVLEGLWRNDHRTVSSVYATARTLVWPWVDPVVAAATGGCSIDPAELLDKNGSLYVCIPLADQHRLRPVLGGLLNDLIGLAYERYVATGKPLDPPVLVVIDEAATLRPDQLPSWAATLAGIGVQLVTAWQSISQIEAAYARQAQAILTNHITKLFYAGMSDPVGLDYVSHLVGDEHLPARLSDQRSEVPPTEPVTTVPVAPPAVLRRMSRGDALLIHATLPPAHIRLRPWYQDRRLRHEPQSTVAGITRPRFLAGGPAVRVAASLRVGSRLRSGSRSGLPARPLTHLLRRGR